MGRLRDATKERRERDGPRSSSAASESRFVVVDADEVALAVLLSLPECRVGGGTFLEFILSRLSRPTRSIMFVTPVTVTMMPRESAQPRRKRL